MKINLELGKAISLINDFLMEHAKNATESKPFCCFSEKTIEKADTIVSEHETLLSQYAEYEADLKQIPEPFASWKNGSNEYD
tara:strand:- start:278 stop:523 length:246 start_codon:yes stop_codon:yes gene_type:complete